VGSSLYARHEAALHAQADRERERADQEAVEAKRQRKAAEEARDEAKREKEEEQRQHRRADRRTRDALEAVDRLLTRGGADGLQHAPQLQHLRRDFLLDALDFSERFLRDNSDDPALRDQSGFAHRRVGMILDRLGEPGQAARSYREALTFFEGLR